MEVIPNRESRKDTDRDGLLVIIFGQERGGGVFERIQLLFVNCQDSINLSRTGEGELDRRRPHWPHAAPNLTTLFTYLYQPIKTHMDKFSPSKGQ